MNSWCGFERIARRHTTRDAATASNDSSPGTRSWKLNVDELRPYHVENCTHSNKAAMVLAWRKRIVPWMVGSTDLATGSSHATLPVRRDTTLCIVIGSLSDYTKRSKVKMHPSVCSIATTSTTSKRGRSDKTGYSSCLAVFGVVGTNTSNIARGSIVNCSKSVQWWDSICFIWHLHGSRLRAAAMRQALRRRAPSLARILGGQS